MVADLSMDDMYAALGFGELQPAGIINILTQDIREQKELQRKKPIFWIRSCCLKKRLTLLRALLVCTRSNQSRLGPAEFCEVKIARKRSPRRS